MCRLIQSLVKYCSEKIFTQRMQYPNILHYQIKQFLVISLCDNNIIYNFYA